MTGPKGGRPFSEIPHCRITGWIPVELKTELELAASRDETSMSSLVEAAIIRELRVRRLRHGNKHKKATTGEA